MADLTVTDSVSIMRLYTVFDRLAQESGPCFESKTDATAMRAFRNLLGDKVNPEEYRLLWIGRINHSTSEVEAVSPPEEILG